MKTNSRKRFGVSQTIRGMRGKALNVSMAVLLAFSMVPVSAFTYDSKPEDEAAIAATQGGASATQGEEGTDPTGQGATPGEESQEEPQGENGAEAGSVVENGSAQGDADADQNSPETDVEDQQQDGDEGDVPDASEENDAQQPSQAPAEDDGSDAGSPDAGATTETEPDDEGMGGGPSDEEAKEPRDPIAWEGDLEAVSFDGWLTVNAGSIDGSAWDAAELPQTVPATLRFKFEIDPAEQELLAGDWVEVGLPSFLHAEEAKLDAFRLGDDDGETDEKIADAEIASGYIKVTLTEDAVAEGSPAVVRGYVDVPVTLPSALLGEEETQQSWVVQVGEDGIERVIVLELPAYDAVLSAWKTAISPIGVLGSVLGLSDGTVTAQSAGARDATTDDAAKVTVAPGSFNYQVGSTITWCDNNYGGRPTPKSLEAGFIPQYSLDGEEYLDLVNENGKVTDQARAALHLDDNAVNRIESSDLIQITQTAVNTYEILTSALPQEIVTTTRTPSRDDDGNYVYDENGDQVFKEESSYQPIKWQLKDTNEYSGYVDGENSAWDHQYKMLTSKVEFNVIGKVGGEDFESLFEGFEEDLVLSASINGVQQQGIPINKAIDQGVLIVDSSEDVCILTASLPAYNEEGFPIVYHVKYEGEPTGGDYYQVSYDNSASASHGSAVDAVYSGGTMTLRHAGTTTYSATKQWLDGNSTERPAVTFTLWRYSTNGGNAATASQVRLTTNEAGGGASQANASYVTVTIQENSPADSVNLHELLEASYGDAIEQLPKYDPDGYPYIYALREEAVPGYEQVFGEVGKNDVVDTAPNYVGASGEKVFYSSPDHPATSRPDNDRFVYNGGTISNRLTGTVEANLTKTWEIAAFQDSFKDVVCTFVVQSREKGSDSDWTDVESDNATESLTGWNAETLTKSISKSFRKYDQYGNELEYRWVESDVQLKGQNTDFRLNDDGSASFQIQVKDAEGLDETLEFTSTSKTEGAATVITNTFKNETEQHVDKFWKNGDTLEQVAPDPAISDGSASFQLFQDGTLIGTYTMDGQVDSGATAIQNLGAATWQETSPYHADFYSLPKYSPEGKRYTYLVLEVPVPGWHTERSYDPDTRTTKIVNAYGSGEGSEIRIIKRWIDGDDAGHRLKVEVELRANGYIRSDAEDENGNPLHFYGEGETVATVTLSSEELWYAEVDVPINGLTYNDFTAVETALIDDKGTEDTADDVRYPVLTKSEAAANPVYEGELWLNAGWTNLENRRVATPEHVYEVRSGSNVGIGACEVTNRRLGLLDLTVEKNWGDGLGDFTEATVADNPRPSATITLSCDEYPQAFSLDEQGNLIVSVSGNRLPVTNSDGSPVKARIVDTDGNGATAGNAVVEIDADNRSSTYTFYGLPKYDANGMNVHYSVNEAWTGDSGYYNSTKKVHAYSVEEGARHFHDTQTIEFNNSRSGTRDVVFYKIWHDNYVSTTLNQRPDIYLTLYRMVEGGQPEAVDDYVHFSWSSLAEDGDAANEQKVTISGMPKYDTNGNEYIYYATEQMSADGTSLDYGAVQFDYESIVEADESDNEVGSIVADAKEAVKIDASAESDDPESDGTGWAIREDGTFVNRLSSTLVATGTKLWENIPGRVSQSDLPDLTVYLQRKLASEDAWPEMKATYDENAGTWSVTGTVGSTSELTMSTNNQYTYTISEDLEGDPLARYNENGDIYEYRAVEVIWGLLDQPGGFTKEDIEGVNLADIRGDETGTSLTDSVYVIQHGETGSFLLRNVYNSEKGNLTVKKLFAGREADDEYPDVTFDVYRYYVGEGGKSTPEFVASHTLTNSDFSTSTDADGNNSATYTFEGLDVYAPDGSRWAYYIVERGINGYATEVAVDDINGVDDKRLGAGETTSDGIRTPDLGTFDAEGNVTGSAIAADETVDATFANTYEPESVNLQGTKEWDDYNDIFSVRPDPNQIKLTFKRTAGGMSEDITTQSSGSDQSNYLNWTQDDATGDWTFVLSNVEKWAPNGQAWTYTVTETMDEDVKDHYTIVTGSSSVSAASNGSEFKLKNALNGKATVSKTWDDGGDPYGLRPSAVTVELQARYATVDEATGVASGECSEWMNAYEVWVKFATEDDLNKHLFTSDSTQRSLSDSNGWRGSWTNLPVLAREDASRPLNAIQYRVVEVQISEDQQVENSPDNDGVYEGEYPYQPSQSTTYDETNTISTTNVCNELEDTRISVSKIWSDDGDKWGIRPGTDTWSVTYLLQRKTGNDDDYSWVLEYSESDETVEITDPLNERIVSQTISGNSLDNSKSATWGYLPKTDANGNVYTYRVVEQVPGGYDVDGGEELLDSEDKAVTATDSNGVTWRYYVVELDLGTGDVASAQTFDNELRTVDLAGTKVWEDFGTGIADSYQAEDMPRMTLYRSIKGGQPQEVTYLNETDGQPEWTKDGASGNWTFTYRDLPAADEQDRPYTYWAEEVDVPTDGFYPLYGAGKSQSSSSHDAEGTILESGGGSTTQKNETITNTATRFTLDKVSERENDGQHMTLNNIQLAIFGATGSEKEDTVYAVWCRDNNGSVSSWVNIDGAASDSIKLANSDVIDTSKLADSGFQEMSGTNAGAIIGLNAGSYRVVETGDAPENHATAVDVPFTINANGSITAKDLTGEGATDNATASDEDPVVCVTVEDPLFRGHVTLSKTANDQTTNPQGSASALAGAKFSLYYDNDGTPGKSDGDSLVATGLTTDSAGEWTSIDSDVPIVATSDIYDEKYRSTLADGLIPGDYYFIETSAPSNVYDPGNWSTTPICFTIMHEDDYHAYVESPARVPTASATNALFRAKVTLTKYDAFLDKYFPEGNGGLEDVSFTLEYKEAGAANYDASKTTTVSTDSNGLLTLNIERKGDYRLTETTPTGYAGSFQATFTIENEDYNKTFNLNDESARNTLSFSPVGSSTQQIVEGKGLPNERIPGSVTLTKTDSVSKSALNGVGFRLECLDSDGTTWKQVTDQVFVTGNTYTLNDANNGVETFTPDTEGTVSGKVAINNLWWGTYRFVEVGGLDGYIEGHENTAKTSDRFTIDAAGVAATQTGATTANVSMTNTPTQLEIRKTNSNGDTLAVGGVEFEVTPADGSAFADSTKTKLELSTDSEGIAKLERAQLILGNNYVIQETAAPEGYELRSGKLTIHVNDGSESGKVAGTIDIVSSADGYAIDGNAQSGIRLTVSDEPIQLKVKKTNTDGTALPGATFVLSEAGGTSIAGITTDENGEYAITSGLKAGVTYTLTETAAPDGYTFMSQPFKFSINSLGKIEAEDQSANGYTYDNTEGVVVVTAKDTPTNLTISKRDAEGTTPLPGAEFTVTPANDAQGNASRFADGSSSKTLTTALNSTQDEATASIVGQLIVGDRYEIKEVKAPDGYTLIDGSVVVEVQADGSLKIVNDQGNPAPDEFVIDGSAINVITGEVKNNPTELTIVKVDADTNNAVFGAQFSLRGTFADGTTSKTLAMSGNEATISLDKALLIADGTTRYTLEETVAPEGFELIAPLTFTVATNGTITPTDSAAATTAGWTVGGDGITLTAQDEPVEIQLTKNGSDGQNNLSGAVFELYEGSSATGNALRQETTDSNGTLRLDKLVANHTYTLHEASAPAGYEVMDDVTFRVAADGTIAFSNPTLAEQAGYSVDNSQGVVQITATDRQVEINLVKSGSDGQGALPGAVFRLYEVNGADRVQIGNDLTTDSQGVISLNKLAANTKYALSEVAAPAGYELMDEFSFTVNSDGGIEDAQGNGYTFAEENGVVTISAVDEAIVVELHKQDLGTAALSGAEFELNGRFVDDVTRETKELTIKLAMDNASMLTLDGMKHEGDTYSLIADTEYTITETKAPAGYELNDPFSFKVNKDGTVSSDSTRTGNEAGYAIDGNGVIVTGHDEPVEIELAKQNGSNQALAGAEFIVKPVEGSTFANASLNESGISVTAGDANALDAQLVAGNAYTVSETKAPAGYELISGSFTFIVNADGSIVESTEEGVQNSDDFQIGGQGNATITATDEPIEIGLSKRGSDEPTFGLDATFALTGRFADLGTGDFDPAAEPETRDVDVVDGAATVDGLVAGQSYVLTETKAPAGYELISGSLTFTVNDDGTVGASTAGGVQNNGAFTVNEDGISIMAIDEPIQVAIAKQAVGSDNPLPGAKFVVSGKFLTDEGKVATESTERQFSLEDESARATIDGLVVGETYTVVETEAPAGYEKLGAFTFRVSDQGTIVEEEGEGYTVEDGGLTIVGNDTPIEAKIVKTGKDNTPLAGATFVITNKDNPLNTLTVTTAGEDGSIVLDSAWLVAGATYTIEETHAPEGFELAGKATFRVGEDGSLVFLQADGTGAAAAVYGEGGSGTYLSSNESSVATITVADEGIAAQLIKQDPEGEVLAGATFELALKDDPESAEELEVGEDGLTALPGLVAGGTYVLREVTAPAGYELNGTAFEFTVGSDGSISAADQEGYVVANYGGVITVTATDEPIEIGLAKSDTEGNALDGARFAIEGVFAAEGGASEGGVTQRTFEVAAEGATVDGLVAGQTYVITELAPPAGYAVAGSFSFTVGADGTVGAAEGQQQAADGAEGYRIAANGLQISIADAPIEAQLVKRSFEGEALEGARFAIEGSFAGDFADEASLQIGPTDADGAADVPAGALVAGQTYVLTEASAPSGFELAGSVQFTVGEDGSIALVGIGDAQGAVAGSDGSGAYSAAMVDGAAVVTVLDEPVEVSVVKSDADGKLLAGAEFQATQIGLAEGSESQTVTATTNADGVATMSGLVAGTRYELSEVAAPDGYERTDETAVFAVNEDGTVVLESFMPRAYAMGSAPDTLTVTDTPLEVSLVKQAPNGAPLAGGEFTIRGAFPDGSTSKSFTSGEDGVVFDRLQLSGSAEGVSYTITETRAPEGYYLPDGSLELVVFDDGTVQVGGASSAAMSGNTSVSQDGGTAVVTVDNQPMPGTELPRTGDTLTALTTGLLGVVGLAAVVTCGVGVRAVRRKLARLQRAK